MYEPFGLNGFVAIASVSITKKISLASTIWLIKFVRQPSNVD